MSRIPVNHARTTPFVELKDLQGLDGADFERVYRVDVIGGFQISRALAALRRRHPGAGMVNRSPIASMRGHGASLACMARKDALNALTVGLARALAPEIRVNAIAPGLVQTPWLPNGLGEQRCEASVERYTSRAARQAVVFPLDVAAAAWWLAAGAAKTAGEVLLLDAGFRLGRDRACRVLVGGTLTGIRGWLPRCS